MQNHEDEIKARTLDIIVEHLKGAVNDCRERERRRAKIALKNIERFRLIAEREAERENDERRTQEV